MIHTVMEKVSVFWHVLGMPLCQSSCMDPIWPETDVGEILEFHPPEIEAPVTLGMSLGTKIFGSKIFSYDKNKMLFYEDFGFMWLKLKFYAQNHQNWTILAITKENEENCLFFAILGLFFKTNPQNA